MTSKMTRWTSSIVVPKPSAVRHLHVVGRLTNYQTSHHAITLGLGDKLFLAPLEKDKLHVRWHIYPNLGLPQDLIDDVSRSGCSILAPVQVCSPRLFEALMSYSVSDNVCFTR